jgi:hypothetical protein
MLHAPVSPLEIRRDAQTTFIVCAEEVVSRRQILAACLLRKEVLPQPTLQHPRLAEFGAFHRHLARRRSPFVSQGSCLKGYQ